MPDRKMNRNNVIAMVFASGLSALAVLDVTPVNAEPMTAGSVLKKMSSAELNAYLTGIVEGLAYARYEKEGKKTDGGMRCIYQWYYNNNDTLRNIFAAFQKFPNYQPNAVMAAMIKQQCGA